MSTIRTLQASFKANANEMKAAIRGIQSGLNDLKTNSNSASRTMSQRMYGFSKSLKTAGNNVGKFSQRTKEIGQNLTKKITVPATAAATAVAGITLVKGFKRLTGIDDARAKLSGLGHDASSTEKIMKSALDSVKGTAYGLDEAATTAASAVAAGIEPGKELTRYLSLTGDAAAIAGTDMSEMGSIFNKVQTAQRAYSGDLNQLADRGIPIYQWLADEAGVTAEEVRDMASDGEISSKMFLNAIDKNIGGAAKKIGEKSFTAALANMWAAVGRLGASFLDAGNKGGGLFSKLKPLINEFTDQLDNMGDFAERAGEKLGDAFTFIVYKVKALKQSYDDLSPSMQSIIKKIALIGSVVAVSIGPVLTVLGMFGNGIKRILSGLSFLTAGFAKVGAILPKLGALFTALTGPIGITIGVIAALTTGFIIAYKKSETFRNIVNKLKDAFVNAVVGIKEFLTTNPQILAFVDSVKKGFKTLKDNVSKAVKAVAEFVIEKFKEIKKFWENEGQQLLEAFQNIFKAIWSVVEPIINAIVKLIEFAFPFIKKTIEVAMKLTKSIIQMVWENIKGIIDGALNVIMGLVKVFSGLFTGDFSKMWEGIKQVFSGALKFIWNYVQLMLWGKMLKGILSLGKLMLNAFKGMWNGIRNVFSTVIKWIVDFVKNRFTAMRTTITNITNAIKSVISKIWNGIKDFFLRIIKWIVDFVKKRFEVMKNNISTIFNAVKKFFSTIWSGIKKIFTTVVKSIVDFVKRRFDNLKNNITKVFNGIKTFTQKTWNTIKKYTIDPVKNMVSTAKTKFGELKKSVTDIFGNIKKTITDRVSDMVKTVTDMPGKMKKGIQKGAGKVKDGFKSVSNKMVEGIEKGVNGVIGGVNWAWSKLGGKKNKFSKWTAPKYAKGTPKKGHPGGLAMVNDGEGSNSGQELIQLPDGTTGMFKGKNVVANLPKGTQVLPAKLTKEIIPQYAWGVGEKIKGAYNKTKSGIKKGAKATASGVKKGAAWSKDKVMDGFDWVKGKAKDGAKYLFNKSLDILGVNTEYGKGFVADFGVRALKTLTKQAISKLTGKAKEYKDAEAIPNVSGGVKSWIGQIKKASTFMNAQATGKEIGGILKQIQRESGGNQGITQSSSVVDINTLSGNPAKGLLQYIPQTFRAYAMKGYGNIMNGYHQLLAFFNNSNWRRDLPYGKRGWGPTGARRYENGGIALHEQLAWLADGGWAESVISHDPAKRVSQQAIWERTGDMLGFTNSKDNKEALAMLKELVLNGRSGNAVLEKLFVAIRNGQKIEIDGHVIAEAIHDPLMTKQANENLRRYMG